MQSDAAGTMVGGYVARGGVAKATGNANSAVGYTGDAVNQYIYATGAYDCHQRGIGTNDQARSWALGAYMRWTWSGVPTTPRMGDQWMQGGVQWHSRIRAIGQNAGNFAADYDAQSRQLVLRNSTTDATETELFSDGSAARITIAAGRSYTYEVHVVGRRTDSGGNSASYHFRGGIKNIGGTTSFTGADAGVAENAYEDDATWACRVAANNTNDALQVHVTGAAGQTIQWVAFVRLTETAV
jgi:hypothetical protein